MANRYERIADDLRRLIAMGTWLVGERLPSELELAARYRVSTPTLRNALEVLQSECLVEKRHGSGNYVRRPGQRMTYVVDGCGAEQSAVTSVAVDVSFETAMVAADGRLSLLLDVQAGSPLTEYVFISHLGTSPRSLTRVYVPHAVAQLGTLEENGSPWGNGVRNLLAAAGVQVMSTTERVTARFPTADEAQTLHITSRTPVLAVQRVSIDVNERVVEGTLLVMPGDRTEILFTTGSAVKKLAVAG
ncbi:GntR family transcriptional regulator [Streptomyces sp. AK02-01A]|uniref:GntR family transcriptional regulator n=1 Tax=Streptomyces sp. AK02-01A TaxID=3028648 RepID=UPI0029B48524|nr:GntR family transcriptional regulator [Streptomyces sp. AK02-01A]MDX3855049.1 GntR family transcriptional regulator [Streptomyces sp. AK02-01A]